MYKNIIFRSPNTRTKSRLTLRNIVCGELSLERNIGEISLQRFIARMKSRRNIVTANYRCREFSLERYLGEISRRWRDISAIFRFNAMPIRPIFRRDISDISQGQSTIFDENRLHYFCTIL